MATMSPSSVPVSTARRTKAHRLRHTQVDAGVHVRLQFAVAIGERDACLIAMRVGFQHGAGKSYRAVPYLAWLGHQADICRQPLADRRHQVFRYVRRDPNLVQVGDRHQRCRRIVEEAAGTAVQCGHGAGHGRGQGQRMRFSGAISTQSFQARVGTRGFGQRQSIVAPRLFQILAGVGASFIDTAGRLSADSIHPRIVGIDLHLSSK
jgi:hypothetical protein